MKFNKKEEGQALVLVLFFSLIATLLVVSVLYMVLRGTAMSGIQKRYQTALDAAYAGVDVELDFLQGGTVFTMDAPIFSPSLVSIDPTSDACFNQKIFSAYPWGSCAAARATPDCTVSPDATFNVRGYLPVSGGEKVFTISEKITDSRSGITVARPPGGIDTNAMGVAYGTSTTDEGGFAGSSFTKQAYIYYAVEVCSKDALKGEAARISFDYAW